MQETSRCTASLRNSLGHFSSSSLVVAVMRILFQPVHAVNCASHIVHDEVMAVRFRARNGGHRKWAGPCCSHVRHARLIWRASESCRLDSLCRHRAVRNDYAWLTGPCRDMFLMRMPQVGKKAIYVVLHRTGNLQDLLQFCNLFLFCTT